MKLDLEIDYLYETAIRNCPYFI